MKTRSHTKHTVDLNVARDVANQMVEALKAFHVRAKLGFGSSISGDISIECNPASLEIRPGDSNLSSTYREMHDLGYKIGAELRALVPKTFPRDWCFKISPHYGSWGESTPAVSFGYKTGEPYRMGAFD